MDVVSGILISVLVLALLYVIFNYKIVRTVDSKFQELYRGKIRTDMQEFYREMEGYTVIFDNKISRFKKLIERQEINIQKWQSILESLKKTRKGKELGQLIEKSMKQEDELLSLVAQLKDTPKKQFVAGMEINDISIDAPKKKEISTTPKKLSAKIKPAILTEDKTSYAETDFALNIIDEETYTQKVGLSLVKEADKDKSLSIEQKKLLAAIETSKNISADLPPKQVVIEKDQGGVASFIRKIGETVRPMLGDESGLTLKKSLAAKSKEVLPEKVVTKAISNSIDDSVWQLALQREAKLSKETVLEKPKGFAIQAKEMAQAKVSAKLPLKENTLDPVEILDLIEKMKESQKKGESLKRFLSKGFNLEQISQLTQISLSELNATKKIYGI